MALSKLVKKRNDLNKQLAEVEKEIEKAMFVPRDFRLEKALEVIEDSANVGALHSAFTWSSSPQGYDYWNSIYSRESELKPEDVIQIQRWIINQMLEDNY